MPGKEWNFYLVSGISKNKNQDNLIQISYFKWQELLWLMKLYLCVFQVQPGGRSEVRRDRAGDGAPLIVTSTSCGSTIQRPYTHERKHTFLGGIHQNSRKLQENWEYLKILLLFFSTLVFFFFLIKSSSAVSGRSDTNVFSQMKVQINYKLTLLRFSVLWWPETN